MPTTTHKYRLYDAENGQYLTPEFADVIATKQLTGVEVVTGSAEITVASTADVYPFMGLSIPGIPRGSFVLEVKSGTLITAARLLDRPAAWVTGSVYAVNDLVYFSESGQVYRCTVDHTASTALVTDVLAGKWTLVSDPLIVEARATSSASAVTGHAHGFNPVPIPQLVYDGATYRNEWALTYKASQISWQSTGIGGLGTAQNITPLSGGPIIHPDSLARAEGAPEVVRWSHMRQVLPDTMAGIPPRPEGKWVSFWHFVHTGGLVTQFPARPGVAPIHTGSTTA